MIFDGHSDLLYDVTRRRLAGENCVLERRHRQKLRKGRIGGLGLSLWVTAEPDSFWAAYPGWDGWRRTEEMMACFQAELADSPWLVPVRTAAEAREVQAAGKTFAFLAVEGMEPVGNRLERLEQYARWGARIGMLTWNEEKPAGSWCRRRSGEWADRAGLGGRAADAAAGDCAGCLPRQ